jgi:Family of unknown function (DUF6328)
MDGQTMDGQTMDGQTMDGQTTDGQTADGQTADGTSESKTATTSAGPEVRSPWPEDRPPETPSEAEARLNRNLGELLQELRISEVGVQILFAFLLTLPFTARFGQASRFERDAYFATLIVAVTSSALMISPAAYHRVVFRHHEREHLVRYASRILLAGLALLLVAMGGAVLVVLSFLFGTGPGAIAGAGVAVWCGFFWYVVPVRMRMHHRRMYAASLAEGAGSSTGTVGPAA